MNLEHIIDAVTDKRRVAHVSENTAKRYIDGELSISENYRLQINRLLPDDAVVICEPNGEVRSVIDNREPKADSIPITEWIKNHGSEKMRAVVRKMMAEKPEHP